ncbi:MAG: MATE family efflux transporter [Pseudomonadota bacterium]
MSLSPACSREWHARIWRLALPIIFSNISVPLVGAVDTAVVGHLPEVEQIGAVALGASIFSLVFWTFGFLRMSTSGLVAQAYGHAQRNTQPLTASVAPIFWRSACAAVVIAGAILLLQRPLLEFSLWLLNTGESLNNPTSEYVLARIWSAPATLANYVVLGTLIGLQRMRAVLIFQLFLNVLNILLDLLFVPVLGWGIQGVAYASVVAEYSALALGVVLLKQSICLPDRIAVAATLFNARALNQLFRLNGNIFIRTLLLVLSFFYFNAKSAALGATVLAANAILLQILHICAYALDGFAHAVETLSGHAWGSRQRQQFNLAVKYSTLQSAIVAVVMSLTIALFGPAFIGWFTNQPPVIDVANLLLPWLVVLPIISVWCYQLDGIFIGTTHSSEMRNAMILSALAYLLLTLWLIPRYGNQGLWLSFSIFMIIRAASLLFYYRKITNNTRFDVSTT